jgi:hypothetical protein
MFGGSRPTGRSAPRSLRGFIYAILCEVRAEAEARIELRASAFERYRVFLNDDKFHMYC